MFRRSKNKIANDYKKDIPLYSNEQIEEILKLREHYQPDAAKLAIQEAIKRGIIYSEQDLFAEKYKVEDLKFSLFPKIDSEKHREKIRRSIARSFVLAGIIPLLYGIVQVNSFERLEGIALVFVGGVWLWFSGQLNGAYHKKYVIGLWSVIVPVFAYVMAELLALKGRSFFDYFIPTVLFLLICYALYFISRMYSNSEN